MQTLDQLSRGDRAVIARLDLDDEACRRVAAFGLLPGETLRVERIAPLGGPLVLQVGTTHVLLRRSLARAIGVRLA
ncbi:FeoA family protein [Paludibacterium paludis]|uniref:Ferrous iron transporter FeoA-like domain-containing protein n=1 Tax=Paludibacterium paludis TaxID=1225769 RepID=A0A918NXL8_9NEIS|nr:FeoA family protein [Paludibacterium paludis]GGY05199.1 hypothetical protein GCM10011289_04720 [Paludibacterium paludis]